MGLRVAVEGFEKAHPLFAIRHYGEIAVDLMFSKRFLNKKHVSDIVLDEKNDRPFLTSTLAARFRVLRCRRV